MLALLLQRLVEHGVEVAAQARAARRRRDFAGGARPLGRDKLGDAGQSLGAQHGGGDGQLVREQLVELGAERVDVGACVDVVHPAGGLLRTHELQRAHQRALEGLRAALEQRVRERLGDAEVDDLDLGAVAGLGVEHVVGAEVPVQHLLLVGVLHGVADHQEQLDALLDGERLLAAVQHQRLAFDQLHDEVGEPARGRARVHQPRDARVVHPVQRLPLGREALQDLARVHARVEDLDGDSATDRPLLLGAIDGAEPAAPHDLLEHVVVQHARQGLAGPRGVVGRRRRGFLGRDHAAGAQPLAQRRSALGVRIQQCVERRAAGVVGPLQDLEHFCLELLGQRQLRRGLFRHGAHHGASSDAGHRHGLGGAWKFSSGSRQASGGLSRPLLQSRLCA